MKYGFIGCGNMGGAIARAMSSKTKDIAVSDRSGKAKALAAELGISYWDVEKIAQECDRIFLAVKPHMMTEVLKPLQKILKQKKPLLITMAAGLEIQKIEEFAGGAGGWKGTFPLRRTASLPHSPLPLLWECRRPPRRRP